MPNPPPHVDFLPNGARANNDQKMYLLSFMERNKAFSQGKCYARMNDVEYEKTWKDLSTALNNFPGAAQKSCSKWMKYWIDQKVGVTGRAQSVNQANRDTRRGPPTEFLSQYDQRVVNCMGGWERVVGLSSTKDPLEEFVDFSLDFMYLDEESTITKSKSPLKSITLSSGLQFKTTPKVLAKIQHQIQDILQKDVYLDCEIASSSSNLYNINLSPDCVLCMTNADLNELIEICDEDHKDKVNIDTSSDEENEEKKTDKTNDNKSRSANEKRESEKTNDSSTNAESHKNEDKEDKEHNNKKENKDKKNQKRRKNAENSGSESDEKAKSKRKRQRKTKNPESSKDDDEVMMILSSLSFNIKILSLKN
ncbi:Halomucin [Frankliniella fusca]|uniref:Halomucin n=1 Tax=Frankliniella fusca TaxID=407009 RepID=A0AAE1LM50_9NEOP|nr:Halomucin [Frankliniella fusca]